jgi:hypothetical protein
MFYFNSYKTEMELVTPSNGENELIQGRVVFLKLPNWIVFTFGTVIIGLAITLAALVHGYLSTVWVLP